ncbi:MAG: spore coat protein CotH [Flavobacteriales bacterium CG_4_9_14_3_um_filter_32_8]|nr:MAG: spore coat protein CotH [Flavobacteriales bacterium CG_4_9_14_3_um_filter_32_8]
MKKSLLLVGLFCSNYMMAQTYSGSVGAINDFAINDFPLVVSSLTPSTIDTIGFGLETICINLTHTYDSDLEISIIAPDGTSKILATGLGGGGDDYTNTCFNNSGLTNITAGTPPFTGTFISQGFMGMVNNGQNGNGIWILRVNDMASVDAGNLLSWSITFGNSPATYPNLNFSSSNLPIVVINTNGQTIQDNARITVDMGIIYNAFGARNFLTDPFNEYNGKITIEYRGSSSQMFPKKPYSIETVDALGNNNNVAIMDMPSENDWVLYAPYSDKSLIRNVLTYHLGENLGRYAPRTKLCELIIDNNYQGVYVFMEKIKRDKNRVDIAKLDSNDLAGDSLTGGYIVKIDKPTSGFGYDWSSPILPPNAGGQVINYQFDYPDQNEILPAQANYIQTYITDFENALNGPNFKDTLLGYRNYIDVLSFIDFFIINELTRNVDGYRLSTFLYKDKDSKGGKINMGPLWDFNLAFGNANYCDGSFINGWAVDFNYVCSGDSWLNPFWWERLSQDTTYNNQLRCRWENLRLNQLHLDTILNYIDTMALYLDESQQRNFIQWPILGTYVWPNDYIGMTYTSEINYLKNWITNRIAWIDANIPGNCYNVGVDELVAENPFSVYPNPTSSQLTVNFSNNKSEKYITLHDAQGKVMSKINTYSMSLQLDITSFPTGIYLLEVMEDNRHQTERIIKY